jgi:hypothetical protein
MTASPKPSRYCPVTEPAGGVRPRFLPNMDGCWRHDGPMKQDAHGQITAPPGSGRYYRAGTHRTDPHAPTAD